MTWTDTHAHIYADVFDPDRDEALARARNAGVRKIYMPNIDSRSTEALLASEARYPDQCIPMMGLHPCSVKEDFEKELDHVEGWLARRKFAAVGEMGTDLYWDKTFWQQQQEAFKIQVGWAKKYKLPLVIHCRESIDETIDLLEPLVSGDLTGIFHCFGGNTVQANRITAMGFFLGIGGVVTFKNSGLDKIIPQIGLEHLVLETDSPYLAPAPHRGKRNEPSYIPEIALKIAGLKQVSLTTLQEATDKNVRKIFEF